MPHGLAEVELTAPAMPPALREPGGEGAGQGIDGALQELHLVARRVHEVDVFGQRLAQRARHRLDPAVGDEPAADLGLDHLLQDLQPALEVFPGEPLVERALADLLLVLGLRHHLGDEAVGVELPQRAVEVVRAADGAARLHAREARDRRAREQAHLVLVHAHQRVEEHLRELLVRHLTHRAALIHRGAELVEVGLRRGVEVGFAVGIHARREHREEHLEHGVEHAVVARVLHERRAERGLERRAIVERHELDRAHRVEVLGHRDRKAGGAELVHEALQHVEHVRLGRQGRHVTASLRSTAESVIELAPLHGLLLDDRGRVDAELFARLGDVALVLQQARAASHRALRA